MQKPMNWSEAIELKAKGRQPGRPPGHRPEKKELQRLYVKEERPIRDIAKILGYSKDKIYRSLEDYGIARRSPARRSKLEKYNLAELRSRAKEKGVRGLARELGINHGTLLHYFKNHPE